MKIPPEIEQVSVDPDFNKDGFQMKYNGIMIDCARLLEPREYYDRLLRFMADWKMNTLLLHFSDDHGLALKIPGFHKLAMHRAFSPDEMTKLIEFARSLGIDVIPELETFGHTRYITNHPSYHHLFAGKRTRDLRFNALDPLNPESLKLMKRMIREVAGIFPSPYIHLGCDEVDLNEYARKKKLDPDILWTDYVNTMIVLARKAGKSPMIWADHVANSDVIARNLNKDVILVDWRYEETIKDDVLPRLKKAGFPNLVAAPSLACYRHRFLPNSRALENIARMAGFAAKNRIMGVITTIWCPWRYLQNTMYYGIAYSSCTVRKSGRPDIRSFHTRFARRVMGTRLEPALESFLESWTGMIMDRELATKIMKRNIVLTPEDLKHLKKVKRLGNKILSITGEYTPRKNHQIWDAMVLAVECVWVCSEGLLLSHEDSAGSRRRKQYNRRLKEVREKMDAEWDRTRFPDDPQKTRPLFPNNAHAYAMLLVNTLPEMG